MPEARHAPKLVQDIATVVEADLFDHRILSGICQLFRFQLVMVLPRLSELLKSLRIRDANLGTDRKIFFISRHGITALSVWM